MAEHWCGKVASPLSSFAAIVAAKCEDRDGGGGGKGSFVTHSLPSFLPSCGGGGAASCQDSISPLLRTWRTREQLRESGINCLQTATGLELRGRGGVTPPLSSSAARHNAQIFTYCFPLSIRTTPPKQSPPLRIPRPRSLAQGSANLVGGGGAHPHLNLIEGQVMYFEGAPHKGELSLLPLPLQSGSLLGRV